MVVVATNKFEEMRKAKESSKAKSVLMELAARSPELREAIKSMAAEELALRASKK